MVLGPVTRWQNLSVNSRCGHRPSAHQGHTSGTKPIRFWSVWPSSNNCHTSKTKLWKLIWSNSRCAQYSTCCCHEKSSFCGFAHSCFRAVFRLLSIIRIIIAPRGRVRLFRLFCWIRGRRDRKIGIIRCVRRRVTGALDFSVTQGWNWTPRICLNFPAS